MESQGATTSLGAAEGTGRKIEKITEIWQK
jgi:hypothetical protein